MNPLLLRQLRKHLPPGREPDASLAPLLSAISVAYDELESDLRLFEHTLELTSEELNAANERLRLESEDRIRELNRYYLETLERQQGLILRVQRSPRGFVHTLCRGALAFRLGWDPSTVEGRMASDFLPEDKARDLVAVYERVWAGEECSHEECNDDGTIWFLLRFQPLVEEGRVVEIIASAVDISVRKRTERELLSAKERAESADRAKSEFLAVMSHEIRTPLNAVLGFTSLLQASPLNADQLLWLDTISQSGRSLLALLNDILDFSKIEAGKLDLNLQPADLYLLVETVVGLFRQKAAEKCISLDLNIAPGLPGMIITDQGRLRQIITNLLSNAVKFTARGTVSVEVRGETRADGKQGLRILVRDSGCGIPPEQHSKLFKPFSQVDASATRAHGGTGLGLAISQRLAACLGGNITFESIPGQGSLFIVSLPVTEAKSYRTTPLVADDDVPVLNCRVLVVEDHPNNRELMIRILSAYGIHPDIAEDGLTAVQAAERRDYDLILMDVSMPGMDGLEATAEIRKRLQGRPRPRIVAVTANAFEEDKRLCREAGMDDVLTKPFVLSDLFAQFRLIGAKPASSQA